MNGEKLDERESDKLVSEEWQQVTWRTLQEVSNRGKLPKGTSRAKNWPSKETRPGNRGGGCEWRGRGGEGTRWGSEAKPREEAIVRSAGTCRRPIQAVAYLGHLPLKLPTPTLPVSSFSSPRAVAPGGREKGEENDESSFPQPAFLLFQSTSLCHSAGESLKMPLCVSACR